MSNFLPQGYVAPASGGYTKLDAGQTQLRILSAPLMTWLAWENNSARRVSYDQPQPVVAPGPNNSVQHAWTMIAWNYKTQKIEIFEMTQKTLQSALGALAGNPAWGHPQGYDIIITKTGSGKEGTKYMLQANPHSPLSDVISAAIAETPIDLNQLLVNGGNPFLPASAGANVNNAPAQQHQKVVTPENWQPGDNPPAGFTVNADGMSLAKKELPFG